MFRTAAPRQQTARRVALDLPLLVALLAGLALRALLWGNIPRNGLISDEGEYLSAASWLAHGHGFDWYQGYLWTRAPLYPLFLAAHLRLFGPALTPIYLTQTILSLANIVLVYALARQLLRADASAAPTRAQAWAPGLAALLMALYLPFALYTQVLLSETLFLTLLLGAFLALSHWQAADGWRSRPLAAAGVLFGLATLTRSIMLPFLPIAAALLLLEQLRQNDRRVRAAWAWQSLRAKLAAPLLLLACAGAIILPWTLYNSRMYGGLVLVDTSGAFNMLLGARTAADGNRDDAATRDFVLVLLGQKPPNAITPEHAACAGAPAPAPSQATRQSAMTREAICLIAAHPLAFLSKSLGELVDLFQINYTGAERFTGGFTTGRLPIGYTLALFALDDTLYVLVLPLAVLGWALMRRQFARRLLGWWWLYNIALAPLLFAINRFRLPLLPFAFIFAAYALAALADGGGARLRSRSGAAWIALAATLAIIATAPYAYLWPASETLPSYFGGYPSSLDSTRRAIVARPSYLRTEALRQALASGQTDTARQLLGAGEIQIARFNRKAAEPQALVQALLDARDGRPADGLQRLPALDAIIKAKDVEAAVVRGDLLRSLGQIDQARTALGHSDSRNPTGFVDDANPVQWAWDWLHPAPLPQSHLDLAGDLDLGYIEGCFLGEGDPGQGTFRWCSDGAQLRFPGAGTGQPQTLTLRADGRGWLAGWLPVPAVQVLLGDQLAGTFSPSHSEVREFSVTLPPSPPGADVLITLRTPTFTPDAARYLSQQGAQVGQAQQLGVRLDWAELREAP